MADNSADDRKLPNYNLRYLILLILTVICIFISFVIGRFSLDISSAAALMYMKIVAFFYPDVILTQNYADYSVIFNIRFPRIVAALLVGSALSVAGAAYQGMFQNPLVSPDILGASAGAGFGAAVAILFGLGSTGIMVIAFFGGLAAVGAAYGVSLLSKGPSTLSMVLAGILVSSLFSAGLSYIKLVADTTDELPAITYWLMGSLASMTWVHVVYVLPVMLIGLIPLYLLKWRINILTLGEDEARSLGVNTSLLRLSVIVCATLLTTAAVSITGVIGWVGLVIPHFARMAFGCDYRRIIPVSVVMGACFLLAVDDCARTMATIEVPIGILTAFLGAPIFAYLLVTGGRK